MPVPSYILFRVHVALGIKHLRVASSTRGDVRTRPMVCTRSIVAVDGRWSGHSHFHLPAMDFLRSPRPSLSVSYQ